jgi:hypothetical protein
MSSVIFPYGIILVKKVQFWGEAQHRSLKPGDVQLRGKAHKAVDHDQAPAAIIRALKELAEPKPVPEKRRKGDYSKREISGLNVSAYLETTI